MDGTIMGPFQCSTMYLFRANILILFILTLSCAILQLNALNDTTHQMVHNKKMSAFNNYNSNSNSNSNSINNNNRFSSVRQILYHRPNQYVNEALRRHKINMNNNQLFKHRVKRKAKPTLAKPLQSSGSITSNAMIYERNSSTNTNTNANTNTIDFSNNKQIHEILTVVHLNRLLLNQRPTATATESASTPTVHNFSDILALNFSHNVIKQIDVSILKSVERVRRLDLSHNHIEMFNVSVSSNQIEWLTLSENRLALFNGKNLKHLKYLDLSCNNMENATQIQINELSELECVNLSGNRLNQIQFQYAIEQLIKLKIIGLAYNRIAHIGNDMFGTCCADIEALDLSHNQITFIESASFSHLLKLQYLDLSHNFIDAISLRAFQPIPNLRELSIAFNAQLSDALQGFISSWSLAHLDMSETGLCEIPNALTQSVRTLNISHNDFTAIRCGDLDSYPLLQQLDISSCQISDIEDDALGRLDMLVSLHLNDNNIAHVPSSLPVNLVRLHLQNNRIGDIQSSAFSHLIHLEVVDLSGNQLTYLPSLPLPRLMVLNLRSTGLRRLSQSIIKMSPKLKVVYLDGNPIKCNELLGIAEWATPCRTDDSIELGSFGSEKVTLNTNNNDNGDNRMEQKLWPRCGCKNCQSSTPPIIRNKFHCANKNLTDFKRTRLTEILSLSNSVNAIKVSNRPANGSSVENVSAHLANVMQNNVSHAAIDDDNDNDDTTNEQSKSTDNLNVTNIMAIRENTQSGNIITNDIQNTNINISVNVKRGPLKIDSNFNSNEKGQTNETTTTKTAATTTTTTAIVLQQTTNVIKKNNVTEHTVMETVMNKINEKIGLAEQEVFHPNQTRIGFDYQILANNVSKQRNPIENDDDEHSKRANETSIWLNKLESLATTEFVTLKKATTTIPTTVQAVINNSNNIQINFEQKRFNQHSKYNVSDHKENKSKVNWNINKAISTANDNLQRDRNLVRSTYHGGDEDDGDDDRDDTNEDSTLDGIHINEINKNQLAASNQLNKSHTPSNVNNGNDGDADDDDDDGTMVAHKNPTKDSHQPFNTLELRKMLPLLNNGKGNSTTEGLNKRIINSNSFTKTDATVINDRNKNGQSISGGAAVSVASAAHPNERESSGKIAMANVKTLTDISSMKANTTNANIDLGAHISINPTILSGTNQRLDNNNNNNTDIFANITDNRTIPRMRSSLKIQADNVKVNNNDSSRHKNDRMQQIKNKTTFPTTTTTITTTIVLHTMENPLIGSISQNVSIIDNERQFPRHININHSMHGQKTFKSSTNTKLQSSIEHVESTSLSSYPQERYDKSDDDDVGGGGGSGVSGGGGDGDGDNSPVIGVSEQWNDKRVTSGHSGLFVIIGIAIGVFVTLNFVHIIYRRHKKRQYNSQRNDESTEQNRQAQNLLIGMQMEMFNSIHYTDTPIDLW